MNERESTQKAFDEQFEEVAQLSTKLETLREQLLNSVGTDFEKLAKQYDSLVAANRFLPAKVGAAAKQLAQADLVTMKEEHAEAESQYNQVVTEYNELDAHLKALVRQYGHITNGLPTSTPEFEEKSEPVRRRMAELKPQISKLTQRLGILRIGLKKYVGNNGGYDPSWDLSEKRIDQLANQHGVVWQSIASKRLVMAVGKNPSRDIWA